MTLHALATSQRPELFAAWQLLLQDQPHLRAREAATQLAVSEAELVASRLGQDTLRLRPQWSELLPSLESLGRVMVLTRNEHCVHERKGVYRKVSIGGSGKMGLVVSPDIDLRLFLSGWSSLFALEQETTRGIQRSLQMFDQQGSAVHKVFLTAESDLDAWGKLLRTFSEPDQSSQLELLPKQTPAGPVADGQIDVAGLRDGWSRLKDVHHFHALLGQYTVDRLQALRLVGREWAEPLAVDSLPAVLNDAADQQLPIMVFVGNRHCVQIHGGPVHKLRWMGDWFNVLDADFNLHLNMPSVAQLWRVRRPSTDGIITSWEAFSAEGELIVQLFGLRKPGQSELVDWRTLADAAPALEG